MELRDDQLHGHYDGRSGSEFSFASQTTVKHGLSFVRQCDLSFEVGLISRNFVVAGHDESFSARGNAV